ncbi:hypothetical protein HRJ34_09450 [Rhizorhabdus wittichii]|uniref:Uncharacterized protein n=1 Tax=Rhizorhabdus wittichii TaxID=160791 RepID=A0A975D6B6_9SPHN|nr:hypothetical protein [Rhizorhabdus wittichii]QTH23702.1 hypothetical protein HRJ34_09450 [Rhizorhabdus wittichii]
MSDHVDSVKSFVRLIATWRKAADDKGDRKMVDLYDKRIGFLNAIVEEVEDLRQKTKPIPASYGDLSDLPPELMKELAGIKVDELEEQIFTVVKAGGDEVDLDKVLIELYRRFGSVQTRRYLQNKLWRMAQKGLVYSVPNRKGVYSAQPQPEVVAGIGGISGSWDEIPRKSDPFDAAGLDDDVPF